MSDPVAAVLLSNFELFVRVAFRHLHDGRELGNEPYIQYLCARLMRTVEPGARTVLNLPPRHLKTLLSAVILPAWLLARDPTEKIMIISYSEQIASDSAYLVRKLLQWEFYQRHFATRLAADRTQDAFWRQDWETEFEQFPHGAFDDQVDAFTQGLDFIGQHPNLRNTQARCVGIYLNSRGLARVATPAPLVSSRTPYADLGRGGRLKKIFPEQA
jgi:hypothetical protein